MALVEHAVEVELHCLGIEGRAIVEGHAFAQVEDVLQPVIRDRPVGCQRGLDLERTGRVAHQSVIDVHGNAEVVRCGGHVRVQRRRLGDLPDDQHVGRRLRKCRSHKRQRSRQHERGKAPPSADHEFLLFPRPSCPSAVSVTQGPLREFISINRADNPIDADKSTSEDGR